MDRVTKVFNLANSKAYFVLYDHSSVFASYFMSVSSLNHTFSDEEVIKLFQGKTRGTNYEHEELVP